MILLALSLAGLALCFVWGFFPAWTEAKVDELLERWDLQ